MLAFKPDQFSAKQADTVSRQKRHIQNLLHCINVLVAQQATAR
jgi:hypothetical protein